MRLVSILGDSISTFEGFNPAGHLVFYDRNMQQKNGLSNVYDTWWARVNQAMRACLCVNNSYSGSTVTGDRFPAAASPERTRALHTVECIPDLILIYIGLNDFGKGVPVGKWGLRRKFKKAGSDFLGAYSEMIRQIRDNYPKAQIVCGTLMRSFIAENDSWVFPENFSGVGFEEYNHAIRDVCKREKCLLADIGAMGLRYESLDGSHPTKSGHLTLCNAWLCALSALGLLRQ